MVQCFHCTSVSFKWLKLVCPSCNSKQFFTKGIILAESFVNWMSHLTQTGIRRWNYFASEQLLVYDIEKFRWCHNVKRFHKSNNIMWVCIAVICITLHCLMVCNNYGCSLFFFLTELWWISKKKCGIRNVMTLSAGDRTTDPPVRSTE